MIRILYVEDNEDNVYMLRLRFEAEPDYEVVVATSGGEETFNVVIDTEPDIILMDLNLPVMDGWETARRLKADPSTRGILIIALTANAMSGDREKALAAGCDDFDTKPVDFKRLLGVIRALLGKGTPGRKV